MYRLAQRLMRNQDGATSIEYGLICALIFLAIVASVTAFTDRANVLFNTVATTILAAMP